MEMKLFDNDELNAHVRSVTINGEPWFVAKDVCDFLGTKTTNLSAIVNADDIRTYTIGTNAGPRNYAIISEPGMYKLVFRSRKPEAETFTDWVTRVVLPAIRKTGHYGLPDVAGMVHKENEWLKKQNSDLVKQECTMTDCMIALTKTNKELQATQTVIGYNKLLQQLVADLFDKNAQLHSEVKELTRKLNSRK